MAMARPNLNPGVRSRRSISEPAIFTTSKALNSIRLQKCTVRRERLSRVLIVANASDDKTALRNENPLHSLCGGL